MTDIDLVNKIGYCKESLTMTTSISNRDSSVTSSDKANQTDIYTGILFVFCVFVLKGVTYWFRQDQSEMEMAFDAENITPSDFTVIIKGIPKDQNEE